MQQLGMRDNRIARLAGEFLDLNGDAVDGRAYRQVAVDAVGIAVGAPRIAEPWMQRAQMRFHLMRAERWLPVVLPVWSAGVSR